jgi:hypothetical protein
MKIKDVVVRNGLLGIATGLSFVSLETRTEVGVRGATDDRTSGASSGDLKATRGCYDCPAPFSRSRNRPAGH